MGIWLNWGSGQNYPDRWTDKSFSATASKLGTLDKPDYDYTNLGLLFPQNDTSEKIYINDQMLHSKKLNTALKLHIHFVQSTVAIPNFVAEYRYHNNGGTIPGFTTINTDVGTGIAFPYTSGNILQILPFPEISPPIDEKVSANFDLIIYRNDNRVTGDVLVKFVDYHFQIDAVGSRKEFIK